MRRLIQVAVFAVLVAVAGASGRIGTLSSPNAEAQAATLGSWSAPMDWPTIGIHAALLHDGRVLQFSYPHDGSQDTTARIWNPADGSFTSVPASSDIFCGGHAFLPDGDLLVLGGQDPNYPQAQQPFGIDEIHRLDLDGTPSFDYLGNMEDDRWYPTATALGDGRVLITSGYNGAGSLVHKMEIWDPSSGSNYLGGPDLYVPLYPWMHLLPNGHVWNSGPQNQSVDINPANSTWQNKAVTSYSSRYDGTSVLLPLEAPGYNPEVLIMGGGDGPNATNTTERINLGQGNADYNYADNMNHARRHANSILLPDGKVLITGGTAVNNDPGQAVYKAEMYNPDANTWTDMAAMQRPRIYHSSALLLPDGRVLTSGTDGEFSAEIYSPPYLFAGPRPTITGAPAAVEWGSEFFVSTEDASDIDSVMLIRPSAVTHSFNQDQRAIELDYQVDNGALRIDAPPNGNIAPPGYYMLFVLDADVPSVASWVKIGDFGGEGGPAGDVDCSGSIDAVDALKVLRFSAGLSVLQDEPCTNLGQPRLSGYLKGDVNCSGSIDSVDALLILRSNAGLPVALPPGCPGISPP